MIITVLFKTNLNKNMALKSDYQYDILLFRSILNFMKINN